MNDKKHLPLSDSELQKIRDDLAETEKRKWLFRLIRTGAAWTAGVVTASITIADAAWRVVEWATKK